jgi:YidC/Oxa1 family membrane protein insertase
MGDNRNFIIAILLSVFVFMGWQHFYIAPRQEAEKAKRDAAAQAELLAKPDAAVAGAGTATLPAVGTGSDAAAPAQTTSSLNRDEALALSPRVKIVSDNLDGSISLTGARFDDLQLFRYRETVDPKSAEIALFSPLQSAKPYFADFGWSAPAGGNLKLPDDNTVWTLASGAELTPTTPVVLTWDNGEGLVFKRSISLDEHFLFTILDSVENKTDNAVTLYPFGRISRTGQSGDTPFYILHEGFIGEFAAHGEQTIKYADAAEDGPLTVSDNEGWLGITDKYWASALIPEKGRQFTARLNSGGAAQGKFQADFNYDAVTIAPQNTVTLGNKLFAGAKISRVIDSYRDQGIFRFNLLIDWGWFWFLTQPLFKGLDFIARQVGNFGISILIMTVLLKLAFFPLANRSYAAMAKMKKLQPEMERLRDRFKDDKMKQQQEIMNLYKKEKVNPLAGCLPILVQIPVFFALYKVLFVTIEMRHAPFFGWIRDLSAPDPTTIFNLFGLIPWDPSGIPVIGSFLMVGIWPLIMGFTMYVQMKMNPAPTDPIQQQIFTWMPIIFTFMLASFPAGLVIYWAWNNTLSVLQQGLIMRQQGVPIELFNNIGLDRFLKKKTEGDKP